MTQTEALKRALELAHEGVEIHSPNSPEYKVCNALIALAQPEQEPVVTDAMVEAAVKAFWGYENSKVCRTAYRLAIKAALQEKFCDNNCVWTDHHPDCKLSQPEQAPVAFDVWLQECESIKAGADIHAGDGGYSEGTQEQYDAFVKVRNKSLAQGRIRDLAEQAGSTHKQSLGVYQFYTDELEKFAELIVRECINHEELLGAIARGWCSEKNSHKTMDPDLAVAIFDEVERQIKQQFGVE